MACTSLHPIRKEHFFLKDFGFLSSFRFVAKLRGNHKDFLSTACPDTFTASPVINVLRQSGIFVTTNEPTLTHHYHSKFTSSSRVYIRVHFWRCTFHGLDKCAMTYICHYSVIQSIFTALKIFYVPPIHNSSHVPLVPGSH